MQKNGSLFWGGGVGAEICGGNLCGSFELHEIILWQGIWHVSACCRGIKTFKKGRLFVKVSAADSGGKSRVVVKSIVKAIIQENRQNMQIFNCILDYLNLTLTGLALSIMPYYPCICNVLKVHVQLVFHNKSQRLVQQSCPSFHCCGIRHQIKS